MDNLKIPKLKMTISMLIFSTIGIFVRSISLPSGIIAAFRGLIGALFLFFLTIILKKRISFKAVKANFTILLFSGTAIGINWMLLFESYKHTTVAKATLCYYLAPVFFVIISSFVLNEKMTVKKLLCTITALFGMTLISGVTDTGFNKNIFIKGDWKGIILAVSAAVFYAIVMVLNKKIHDIGSFDKTIVQLITAAIIILPYSLAAETLRLTSINPKLIILTAVVGILHTGVAYTLYFSAVKELPAQSTAILSYIDPAVAVLLSVLLLNETMKPLSFVGGLMILSAAMISELTSKTKDLQK